MIRMTKDGAIILVNEADVAYYESVGFVVDMPAGPVIDVTTPRPIGRPRQEPPPKPREPRP